PNPIIAGQNITYTVSVMNTATVQQGATLNISRLQQQQATFSFVTDYCKNLIETSGYECPLEQGNYTFIFSEYFMTTPNDPKNTTVEIVSRTEEWCKQFWEAENVKIIGYLCTGNSAYG
ncbi:4833_t:CDS:2, partial [Cetraspora pellucida]